MRAAACFRRSAAAAALLLAACPPALGASQLVADLSSREIAITTGFEGAELLLFGVIDETGDIVVVVRGPTRREVVRRKERIAGVWVNTRSMAFDDVPAYYRVASTRPLADIAPFQLRERWQIGEERLHIRRAGEAPRPEEAVFRKALLRAKRRSELYSEGEIAVIGKRLFRTAVIFPANVPTGTYAVEVFLFRDKRIVDRRSSLLTVRKVGLEAEIFDFAHQQSTYYGVIAILIALLAGWLAGMVFRKS